MHKHNTELVEHLSFMRFRPQVVRGHLYTTTPPINYYYRVAVHSKQAPLPYSRVEQKTWVEELDLCLAKKKVNVVQRGYEDEYRTKQYA
jgi:hypothetical protein